MNLFYASLVITKCVQIKGITGTICKGTIYHGNLQSIQINKIGKSVILH